MKERYWLRNLRWREVTKEEFCRAERDAGFHPKGGGDGQATGSFSDGDRSMVEGRTTYDERDPNQR